MSVAQALRVETRLGALLREYPGHPYKKWLGAHWRLLSLVDLGLTETDDRIVGAVDRVLQWLLNPRRKTPRISGRYRQCASMDGKRAPRMLPPRHAVGSACHSAGHAPYALAMAGRWLEL